MMPRPSCQLFGLKEKIILWTISIYIGKMKTIAVQLFSLLFQFSYVVLSTMGRIWTEKKHCRFSECD